MQDTSLPYSTLIFMNIHEYQAKALLEKTGIPVPPFRCAETPEQALHAATALGGEQWVVKAQVHAGGRGKAGGVKLVHNLEQLEQISTQLLSKPLITQQSAPNGQPVHTLLIQTAEDIRAEFYLGLLIDRHSRRVCLIASKAGGMDIETVAREHPEQITSIDFDPMLGVQGFHIREVLQTLGLDFSQLKDMANIVRKLYELFWRYDLSLIEINPLILTEDNQLKALDTKISLDDNALFRHPDLQTLNDPSQSDEKENRAKEYDLSYIALHGNIACMVNGAGLAMATMDIIQLHGGTPANFLDVGGGATTERVTEAFKIICSDSNVKAILVNIFGGIVRCDVIAEGILSAIQEVGLSLPIVVRLEGTNARQGRELFAQSDLDVITAQTLDDAAEKAVAAAAS